MIKQLMLFMFLLLIIPLASADLGTFQQNSPVEIKTILNTTSVNISTISYPNSTLIISNQAMTKNGLNFNYTFYNTSTLGVYVYSYFDAEGNVYVNSFTINGSGQEISQAQINLLWVGIVVLLLVAIFFFILSILFKTPIVKIFLMGLSCLTMIVLIGLVTSNATVYLAEFSGVVNIYDKYYILIISLAGASMVGLMVWLIYYSLMLFNKSRGKIPEDD